MKYVYIKRKWYKRIKHVHTMIKNMVEKVQSGHLNGVYT